MPNLSVVGGGGNVTEVKQLHETKIPPFRSLMDVLRSRSLMDEHYHFVLLMTKLNHPPSFFPAFMTSNC